MNLSDLIAPGQGKVQPSKGSPPPEAVDEADTAFAGMVSEQSATEPHTVTEAASVAPGTEASATPGVATSNDTAARRPVDPIIVSASLKSTDVQPKVAATTIPDAETPNRTDGERAPKTVAIAAGEITATEVTPEAQRTEKTGSVGVAIQPIAVASAAKAAGDLAQTPRAQSGDALNSRAVANAKITATSASSGETATSSASNTEAKVQVFAQSTATSAPEVIQDANKQTQPLDAEVSLRPGAATAAAASAQDADIPIPATTAAQNAVSAGSPAPTAVQVKPANPLARTNTRPSISDDAATTVPNDEPDLDVKVTDRTALKTTPGPDLADLPRITPRALASSALPSPAFQGLETALATGAGGGTSQALTTAITDSRTVFPDPRVAAQSIAPQVVNAVAARIPGTIIDVTLDPPELGRIEIMLDFAENGVRASLSAERQATGDLLRRHSDILAEHFEKAGFTDVDLSFGDPRGDTPDRSGSSGVDDVSSRLAPNPDGAAASPKRSPNTSVGTGIDILL